MGIKTMTAPAPKYRYTFAVPIRHVMVRGNTTARTVQEVRDWIAMHWGAEIAEAAQVQISTVVSIGTETEAHP